MLIYRFLAGVSKGFFFVAFFLVCSSLFSKTVFSQDNCAGSLGTSWRSIVTVIDQNGQRWGRGDQTICGGVNTHTWVYKNSAVPNNYVRDVTWTCSEGGVFDIREYRSCGVQTLGVALGPPPGYECVDWEARNESDNSLHETGTGCWMTFQSNQGLPDDSRKLITMRIRPMATPTPVPPPGNPSNLDFNCNNPGTSGRLTWTAGANASYYAIRFNNLNNGWNGSCASPLPGDFCVNTVGAPTFYDYSGVDPYAEYEVWMHAVNSAGVWSGGAVMSKYMRCTPNCRIMNSAAGDLADFTAPPNTNLTFTTRFTSHDGDLSGAMYYGNNLSAPANTMNPNTTINLGASTIWGDRSFTWQTPATPGVYAVRCRAWNDARVECRAPGTAGITGNAIKACDSTNSEVLVTVAAATSTPTPTCAVPAVPTLTGSTCTNDTTPTLRTTDRGVACYPHDVAVEVYSDVNDNNVVNGADSLIRSSTINNAFNAINTNYDYVVSPALGNGSYLWRSRVRNDLGVSFGSYAAFRDLDVDTVGPVGPNPSFTFNAANLVTVSWPGVLDNNCGGLHSTPYWVQLTDVDPMADGNPDFDSVWPGTWFNSWQAATTQTSTVSCSPGQPLWAHVLARDTFDQQTIGPTVQANCPSCPASAPTVTFTCAQRPNSQLFNTTVTWNQQPICVLPHQFNARVSTNNTFPAANTDETGFQNAPPYTFTSTNNGFGYPANPSGTNDVYAQVQVDDGGPIVSSAIQHLNLGCSNLGQGDCTCPAVTPTPGPVGGMLRYCPEPPAL